MDRNFQLMNPLVSIIIPVFNSEKYLDESIRSALDQTHKNIELIIVDDGSTDNSLSIAKSHEGQNVKIITQTNKGASAARNTGLNAASGDFIQYLDADDLLSLNKLEDQLKVLNGLSDWLSISPTVYFNDNNNPLLKSPEHGWQSKGKFEIYDFLIRLYGGDFMGPEYGGMITVHSWLIPKKVADAAGKWDERLSLDDDGEYFCRIMLAAKGVVYSHNSINYYRKYSDESKQSISGMRSDKAFKSALLSNKLKAKHLLEKYTDPIFKTSLSRFFWENAISFYPQSIKLSTEAEQQAKKLDSSYHFKPYRRGIKAKLANTFSWKLVRYLEYMKNHLTLTP